MGPGVVWVCPACDGRAVGAAVLRELGPKPFFHELWASSRAPDARTGCACPSCRRSMRLVDVTRPDGRRESVDVCPRCLLIWFDTDEMPAPRTAEVADPKVWAERSHAAAERRFRSTSHVPLTPADSRDPLAWPEETWKVLPGLLGLPVEFNAPPTSVRPWATWGLLALVAAVSLLAFTDLPAWVRAAGFVAADPWRHGGLTFLTVFFLHGDALHLLGNLYFLWVFGDNVEDHLGVRRYLLLLLLATVAGDLAHMALTKEPTVPLIGASGGISGVIVFYALQYPRVRLGVLFWFLFWIRFPASVGLVLWIGLQLLGLALGTQHVAYGAHLGGAGVGLLAWAVLRSRTRVASGYHSRP